MLRGLLSFIVLIVSTGILAIPVLVIVALVPRWSNVAMDVGRFWSRIMLRTVGARVRYHGLENATAVSPCVFIANHQSNVDIWALLCAVPRSTRFVAKRELFRIPLFGWVLRASGFISIDRGRRADAIRSLDLAASKIRGGRSVLLFPEGTRSKDGRLQPFKKGAFHLALQAGVPIIPVAIRGTHAVMPSGSFRVRAGDVDVFFEPPVEVLPFRPDGQAALLDRIHATLAARLEGDPP